jgi:DNA-directed RNA polymerase subunit RPC12/RpoP
MTNASRSTRVTVACEHCGEKMFFKVGGRPPGPSITQLGSANEKAYNCLQCEKELVIRFADPIISGPFPA